MSYQFWKRLSPKSIRLKKKDDFHPVLHLLNTFRSLKHIILQKIIQEADLKLPTVLGRISHFFVLFIYNVWLVLILELPHCFLQSRIRYFVLIFFRRYTDTTIEIKSKKICN